MLHDWTPPAAPRDVPPAPILQPSTQDVDYVADLVRKAKTPVIVTETSGRDPKAFSGLVELADLLASPVINGRANAYANFPTDHPLYLGMGNYKPVDQADLVLLVGGRAPWYPAQRRPTTGRIIAINDNPLKGHMIYQNLHIDFYLEGDIAASLGLLAAALRGAPAQDGAVKSRRQRWAREHKTHVAALRVEREKAQNGSGGIHPLSLMGALGEVMPADTIYVDETITHSPMLREHLPQTQPQSFFRGSGGLGQGIGTALGIKLAARERPVALLVGDGSFLYNPIIQALGASQRHELPIVIVVLNNKKYAAMGKGHVHHYPEGVSATKNLHYGVTIDGPDYAELGSHFGFHGERVEKSSALKGALKSALAATKEGKTSLLNVVLTR
jgi:acetolactate synthase-1/2/3 large subunit